MINKIMTKLSDAHPSFYYLSTPEIAIQIKAYIDTPGNLSKEEQDLLHNLSQRDIQILLSLHS